MSYIKDFTQKQDIILLYTGYLIVFPNKILH